LGFWFAKGSWIFTCKHVVENEEQPQPLFVDLQHLQCEFFIDGEVVRYHGNAALIILTHIDRIIRQLSLQRLSSVLTPSTI
jgi:hypothetical protein